MNMYDEKLPKKEKKETVVKEKRSFKKKITLPTVHFDAKSALKKIGILAVVVFAFIFITTKISQGSEKKVFEKNLESLRSAAYRYFKENERPTEKDEEMQVTLQELIDEDYADNLQDKKGNVCDPEESNITIIKNTSTKYDLVAHLNCGEKEKEKTYQLTYTKTKDDEEDDATEENGSTTYYKMQKPVNASHLTYSCPSGYILSGTYCYQNATTLTATPTAKYKTTQQKITKASYKSAQDEYEYVDAILVPGQSHYTCSDKDATLVGDQCIIQKPAVMKTESNYTCSEGELDGTKCVISVPAIRKDYRYTCPSGTLIGDQCEITRDYYASYECPSDYPHRDGDRCYYTSRAERDWGDWHKTSRKTYTKEMDNKNTDSKKYELVDTYDGKNRKTNYVYVVYTRQKENICYDISGENVVLKGSKCYHYISAYEDKDCPYGYDLNEEENRCVKYVAAKETSSKIHYECPSEEYDKRGSGENTTCVLKKNAQKVETSTPKCSSGYNAVANTDGTYSCVKTLDAKLVTEEDDYICPTGYTKKGTGKNTKCYLKTEKEGYYYCKNTEARLEGQNCIVDAKTEFIGYTCPSGYDLNGEQCIKVISGTKKKATSTKVADLEYTYKWSTKKEVAGGWTWTGETKQA